MDAETLLRPEEYQGRARLYAAGPYPARRRVRILESDKGRISGCTSAAHTRSASNRLYRGRATACCGTQERSAPSRGLGWAREPAASGAGPHGAGLRTHMRAMAAYSQVSWSDDPGAICGAGGRPRFRSVVGVRGEGVSGLSAGRYLSPPFFFFSTSSIDFISLLLAVSSLYTLSYLISPLISSTLRSYLSQLSIYISYHSPTLTLHLLS